LKSARTRLSSAEHRIGQELNPDRNVLGNEYTAKENKTKCGELPRGQ